MLLENRLLEALGSGEVNEIAAALRCMATTEGFELPTAQLSPFFSDAPYHNRAFPRRIVCCKLTKGRPKKDLSAITLVGLGLDEATPFFTSIATGDLNGAHQALAKTNTLRGQQLELLADLFDLNKTLPDQFAWRLKLQAKRGRPPERLTLIGDDFELARLLRDAVDQFPNAGEKEAAIQHVTSQTGMGRSAVASAMERLRIRSPNWKIQN